MTGGMNGAELNAADGILALAIAGYLVVREALHRWRRRGRSR